MCIHRVCCKSMTKPVNTLPFETPLWQLCFCSTVGSRLGRLWLHRYTWQLLRKTSGFADFGAHRINANLAALFLLGVISGQRMQRGKEGACSVCLSSVHTGSLCNQFCHDIFDTLSSCGDAFGTLELDPYCFHYFSSLACPLACEGHSGCHLWLFG